MKSNNISLTENCSERRKLLEVARSAKSPKIAQKLLSTIWAGLIIITINIIITVTIIIIIIIISFAMF